MPAADAYRLGDGAPVTPDAARALWSSVAREVLQETARRYNATIAEADLTRQVQQRSGVHTRAPGGAWIPAVLSEVAAGCAADDEPDVTALCRRADQDDDLRRAEERLRCYQRFAVDLPDDGGRVTVLQRPAPPRPAARPRKPAQSPAAPRKREAPINICPTCFMALPASGRCDTCG